MPHDCNGEGCSELDLLRQDLAEKHSQNRRDIHALRNEDQKLYLKLHELELKLIPIVGDGRPGLLERMSDQITALAKDVQEIVLKRAKEEGTEHGMAVEKRHRSRVLDKAVAIIGLLLVLAQVYVMVRDSRRQDSIDTLTTIIERQNKSINDIKTQTYEDQSEKKHQEQGK